MTFKKLLAKLLRSSLKSGDQESQYFYDIKHQTRNMDEKFRNYVASSCKIGDVKNIQYSFGYYFTKWRFYTTKFSKNKRILFSLPPAILVTFFWAKNLAFIYALTASWLLVYICFRRLRPIIWKFVKSYFNAVFSRTISLNTIIIYIIPIYFQ